MTPREQIEKAGGCYVVSIGTDCGKTVASAVLCAKTGWDYFKPVQTGTREGTDADFVGQLSGITIWPSLYSFADPVSPHQAEIQSKKRMKFREKDFPQSNKPIVVESAGGLLSPLNQDLSMLDLGRIWKLPFLLVIPFYLGSINHTMLTVEHLKREKVPVAGFVWNGKVNPYSQRWLEPRIPWHCLGEIPDLKQPPDIEGDEAGRALQLS